MVKNYTTKQDGEYLLTTLIVYTIFISALLLFQIQPILAKYILPRYGGVSAVWTTCLLFFQTGLLIGYSYVYMITTFLSVKTQAYLHFLLLFISLTFLPVSPEASVQTNESLPIIDIILLLSNSIGLPYILLSATSPLLQHWFGQNSKKSPYRLYALSNLGSLIALLSYPIMVETLLKLKTQMSIWSFGYLLFSLFSFCICIKFAKSCKNYSSIGSDEIKKLGLLRYFFWLSFSATGTSLLYGTTNYITLDLASFPFLWIIPLSLYLISFIITFEYPKLYYRPVWYTFFFLTLALYIYTLQNGNYISIQTKITILLILMFVAQTICHGELERDKPSRQKLTIFYLFVATGGVLGGLFVNVYCITMLKDLWELRVGIFLVIILLSAKLFREYLNNNFHKKLFYPSLFFLISILITTIYYLAIKQTENKRVIIYKNRNFYGNIQVYDLYKDKESHIRTLLNGSTAHGSQYLLQDKKDTKTTYYAKPSGVGLAMLLHPKSQTKHKMKVGVIGLGTGTLASYSRDNDEYSFYEINPETIKIAKRYFTYLKEANGKVNIYLGDGRLLLQNQLYDSGPSNFDVLVIDAFNSDSIPVHILTEEAFQLYFEHLDVNGIMAFHISNRYFDFKPLLFSIATKYNYKAIAVESKTNEYTYSATWILLTNNEKFTQNILIKELMKNYLSKKKYRKIIWTDDFHNLLSLLK